MEIDKIPEDILDEVAGGEGVSQLDEAVLVMMIINAKLHDMSLEEFLRKHPKYAANPDMVDYMARVWNNSGK